MSAQPAEHFALPPYHVEVFPIGACVCNRNSMNVLTFHDQPGRVFTTEEDAMRICAAWNDAA